MIPFPSADSSGNQNLLFRNREETVTLPSSSFLNLAPGPGCYQVSCSVVPMFSVDKEDATALPLDLESGSGIPVKATMTESVDITLSQDSLAAAAAVGIEIAGPSSEHKGSQDLYVVIDFVSDD